MERPIITDRIYISGPISGLKREEYMERFELAEKLLRSEGYVNIVNPTRLPMCKYPWLYRILGYRLTLFIDLWILTHCQRIYKMPGWRQSHGAQIESCVAYHFSVFPIAASLRKKYDEIIGEIPSTNQSKDL